MDGGGLLGGGTPKVSVELEGAMHFLMGLEGEDPGIHLAPQRTDEVLKARSCLCGYVGVSVFQGTLLLWFQVKPWREPQFSGQAAFTLEKLVGGGLGCNQSDYSCNYMVSLCISSD